MDVVNFDALKAQGRILDLANVDPEEDYLIIGKYTNDYTTNSFKYTKYPIYAIKAKDLIEVTTDGVTITGDGTPGNPLVGATAGVQSVTGLNTNNADPLNPIVKISVDGVTITGQGTPASPLVAVDPRPYKVYAALLTQTGTNAPVATVLENTIGNIVWTRGSTGYYIATLSAAFTTNKTVVLFGNPAYTIPTIDIIVNLGSINSIDINTIISGVLADNSFNKTFIEIRVYN
jgi:hypothetical protein